MLEPLAQQISSLSSEIEFPFKWPQIMVVGGVGVGKSSVVRRLLGMSAIPVGVGCVTRRQVQFTPLKTTHQLNEDKTLELIRQHSMETLCIHCNSTPTPVWDFPGLAQMARPGQPEDIFSLLRAAIRERHRPGDVIVAVVAATEDFVNAEVINVVRELDPHGDCTIFVVTKVDLVRVEACDFGVLLASARRHPVLVRNCGFSEGESDADAVEREFFAKMTPVGGGDLKFGIAALEREIGAVIADQARAHYSRQQLNLERSLASLTAKHDRLKDPSYLVDLLTNFLNHLRDVFEGKSSNGEAAGIGYACGHELPAALEAIEPAKGVSIEELQILFKNSKGLKEATPFSSNRPFQALVREELKKYEKVVDGLFYCVLNQVKALILIGKVDEESGEAFFDIQNNTHGDVDFDVKNELIATGMAQAINSCVLEVIEGNALRAHTFIKDFLAMEAGQIHTSDPQFWRECQRNMQPLDTIVDSLEEEVPLKRIRETEEAAKGSALDDFLALFRPRKSFLQRKELRPTPAKSPASTTIPSAKPEKPLSPILSEEFQFTLAVLKSYLSIVRRNLVDSVPKAIAHFLITKSLEELPAKLFPLALKRESAENDELIAEIQRIQSVIARMDSVMLGLLSYP